MNQESLAARYRPQTFAEVAGQESIKRILSRASATGRVAPAYLFSGTRGVGKTTLARIFAKALNCRQGPAEEPCNQCPVCRQITQGAAVDVVEIDGASNNGVDHVRRLKEDVGYAPLECRYKVIIIDEAHMLSRGAFNALLKTLEEPPGHVTFIMATTEPEKFPQTIVSRCQHFVFKRLGLTELTAHLRGILERENIAAEPAAIQLLARRGAGSVRDSMSLLSQVLALGAGELNMAGVREVLGLAGSEIFVRLMECVRDKDLAGLHGLLGEILDQGADLGFFLRELAVCWRNLFLLRQMGDGGRALMDLPAEEVELWAAMAPGFDPAHLHAGWQMTLESQRRVLSSMEPPLALELLLLNLAYLPELLLPGASRPVASSSSVRSQTMPDAGRGMPAIPARSAPSARQRPAPAGNVPPARPDSGKMEELTPSAGEKPDGKSGSSAGPARFGEVPHPPASEAAPVQPQPSGPRTWDGFAAFCQTEGGKPIPGLDRVRGEVEGAELVLRTQHAYLRERLEASLSRLAELARRYYGASLTVRVDAPTAPARKTKAELKSMADADPVVREAQEIFQARIMDVRAANGNSKENGT